MRLTTSRFGMLAALAVLAAPLSAAPPAKAAHTEKLDAATRGAAATVDAFHGALRRGDTRAAAALLAKDALIFEAGGVERSKAEYEAHHLPADAEFSRTVSSAVTRRAGRSDGALAWIASEGRTTGTYRGRTLDVQTTETMILRRAGGVWKIVHIHWSSSR
jgi:ketosteroid isomerase-like protein